MTAGNQKISIRQLCIFYIIYSLSIKVLVLPSILSPVSAAIGAGFEILSVAATAWLVKKLNSRKIAAKIVFAAAGLILIIELFLAVQTTKLLVTESLRDLPGILFYLPLIIAGLFFAKAPVRAFFRAGEILWWFILIAFIIAIIPTIYSIDLQKITNLSNDVFVPNLLYFDGALFILIFASESEKYTPRKVITASLLCGVFFVAFTVLFAILFETLAAEKTLALIDITMASKHITDTGAFDFYIAGSSLTMLIMRAGVTVCAIAVCIKKIFNVPEVKNA
jgi:hypothetical protein